MMNRIGRERGWPPTNRASYEAAAGLRGAAYVGDPAQVAEKILFQHGLFGHDRFLLQLSVGTVDHDRVLRAIELFATEVAPLVRAGVARTTTETASVGSRTPSPERSATI
jgi:alkanesulfonate monooxygenase SsuD/methylene tetrahydromethanopterin reductase-like flavin-dependent oxidoreductase (luciferase family)